MKTKIVYEYKMDCPFCGMEVVTTYDHIMSNDRVCCMHCNKAFSIESPNEENDYDKNKDNGYYGD